MQAKLMRSLIPLMILLIFLLQISSCVHEPVQPMRNNPPDTGINPIDTTTNPIDTTQNPIDTTRTDTIIKPCDPDTVYFERDLLPILISNCAKSGCHDEASAEGGVILTNYNRVFTTGDVKPGDPENSDLYERLVDDDSRKRMPPVPADPLPQDQIDLLYDWIAQGAQDLSCGDTTISGACDTTSISLSQHLRPVLDTHCTGCHQGQSPSGGIRLNTFAGLSQAASSGKLLGAISHEAGFSPMPQNGDKLSDCVIAQFQAWINDGAQDN